MAKPPWRLLSLAPARPDRVRGWFAGIDGLTTDFPAERSATAVRSAIGDADIVLSDWSKALRIDAPEVAAAGRLSFVMSPSVGLDNLDLEALTAAGVVVANTAGPSGFSCRATRRPRRPRRSGGSSSWSPTTSGRRSPANRSRAWRTAWTRSSGVDPSP